MMRFKRQLLKLAMALLSFSPLLFSSQYILAQSTASLTGTITDSSGAIVTDAKVLCRNSGTGLVYSAVTNEDGLFSFPDMPVGSYDLTITHSGFATWNEQNIVLATGRSVDVPVRLEVGQASQSIEVTGTRQEVQPTSSVLQTSIENTSMQDLPLNGRNPLQLLSLAPGTIYATSSPSWQSANSEVEVNGGRGTDNGYLMDGVNYTDVHYGTAPILPSPDALQEFTVKTSNFSAAESGGGGNVQFTTRSGTNQLHGSVFEYVRNNDFDTKNYFSTAATPFKRNQLGGSLGGPIIKDKTFFFLSYQGTPTVGGATPSEAVVPSTAFRAGDFSASTNTIIDPNTGLPFPQNTIPTDRFDAATAQLMTYYPLPNLSNGDYTSLPRTNQDDEQFLGRLDHQLTAKDHAMARFFYDDYSFQEQTSTLSNPYGSDRFLNRNLVVADTHTFGPNLLLVTAFGFTDVGRQRSADTDVTAQELPGVNVPLAVLGFPPQISVSLSTFASFVSGTPITVTPKTYQYRTHVTWEHKVHTVQFGIDVVRNDEWSLNRSDGSGVWSFDGSRTSSTAVKNSGNPFADFLLGLPVTFTQEAAEPEGIYETKIQPWVQDDWRIRPRLTLNLGLRYEPWLPANDRLFPQVGFEAGVQSTQAPGAPLGLLFSGDNGLPHAIFSRDMNNLSPLVGFAWDVSGDAKNVVRGAYGIFYRPSPLNLQRFSGSTAAFRSLDTTIDDPQSFENPYATVGGDPYPWTPPSAGGLKTYVFPNPTSSSALIPHSRTSYVQEWNLTVERQLTRDLGVSVAYVGNHMIKGMDSTEGNPAIYIPGQCGTAACSTQANVNSRRPYKGLASLQIVSPFQFSNYNALQVSVTKHTNRGLTLISSYTWSKCMDNDSSSTGGVTVIDKFDINADYARCDFSVDQLANASVVYDLPSISRLHGIADKVLNHWQVTTITFLQSGSVFSIYSGVDNSLTGPTTNSGTNDLADRTPGVSTARPAGVSKLHEYFNTAAYTENALGTFGNSGRNSLTGPIYWDSDVGLLKNIPITGRVAMTLRFEGFNAPNYANFSTPTNTYTSGQFGKITSAGSPRVVQIAGRLTF